MTEDILLDENNDVLINEGDFVVGDSLIQELGILLSLNQGELRSDPLLGPNLVRMINSKATSEEIQTIVKTHLAMDGKDYEQVKNLLQFNFR